MDSSKLLGLFLILSMAGSQVAAQTLCHLCDSSTNKNCATLEDTSGFVGFSCLSGVCAVWIEGETTHRGCETSLPTTPLFSETCAGELCNNFVFPASRVQCRQCDEQDPACAAVSNPSVNYACPNYRIDDQCYTYVHNMTAVNRGCTSDSATTPCATGSPYCVACSGSGCNNIPISTENPLSCITCNSATNPNCANQMDNSLSQRCSATLLGREASDECVVYRDGTTTNRGCYDDFQAACSANPARCERCTGTNCNRDPETCIVCSSATDPNCVTNTAVLTPQSCPVNGARSGCYRREQGAVVTRGCASSLSDDDFNTCSIPTSNTCKICQGNACNVKPTFQSCVVCDSLTNENCARVETSNPIATCQNYLDTCRMFVLALGERNTVRGCTAEVQTVTCTPTSNNCNQCTENNCNSIVFPAARRGCHHCNGEANCQIIQEGNNSTLRICRNYNLNDRCYSVLNANNQILRGCDTDTDAPREVCTSQATGCIFCGVNGCNNQPAYTNSNLACINCTTIGQNDASCRWGFQPSVTMPCTNQLPLGATESCYIKNNDATGMTERGCSFTNSVTCGPGECTTCTTNGCNNANLQTQSCIKCRSSVDGQESCSEEGSSVNIAPSQCYLPIQEYYNRGCYVTRHNGDTVRGCTSDLSPEDFDNCLNEDGSCRLCLPDGCNNQRAYGNTLHSISSATTLLITFLLIIKNILN